ncbi:hypothetical protein HKD37_06G016003 [Glycine soja]|nr:hypothetical protein JHK87_015438 [Glycine soja]
MKSFEAKGKETEELHKRFKKLEQEWQGFKDSKPTTRTTRASHKHSLHSSNETIHKPRQYSPRELMFNLQQEESPSPEEEASRTNDRAVQEILQERRQAIERGKLKGRRLFQSEEEDENSSHEVRSMSFNEDGEFSESERAHDYCTHEFSDSSSSSSLSCLVGGDNHDQDNETVARLVAMIMAEVGVASNGRRGNGGTRYAVFLGGVVAIILLGIAMFMRLGKSFGGDDCDMHFVPT